MPPWRDVRGDRRLLARFVDGPLAGSERQVAAAPNGSPPKLLIVESEPGDGDQETPAYELVSWGDAVARYRVRS